MEINVVNMDSVEMARKKKGKKGKKREDKFPQFPTDVDIMVEVVGKNVDKIFKTCNKGNGNTVFRLLSYQL